MSQQNLDPKNLYQLLSKYIGRFLQIIAGVNFALVILLTCITFLGTFATLIDGDPLLALLSVFVLPVGLIVACVSAAPLFAFGQVVDDIHAIRTGQSADHSDELPTL